MNRHIGSRKPSSEGTVGSARGGGGCRTSSRIRASSSSPSRARIHAAAGPSRNTSAAGTDHSRSSGARSSITSSPSAIRTR